MVIKNDRLQSNIFKTLNIILQKEFRQNKYLSTLTIHEVKLSKDKKNVIIYYSYFDVTKKLISFEKELKKNKKYIRMLLCKKIAIANVPELIFKYDDFLNKANRIEEILKKDKKTNV